MVARDGKSTTMPVRQTYSADVNRQAHLSLLQSRNSVSFQVCNVGRLLPDATCLFCGGFVSDTVGTVHAKMFWHEHDASHEVSPRPRVRL